MSEEKIVSIMVSEFAKVKEEFAKIDQHFEKIDQRLEKIEERLDKVEERLDKVEERLDKMEDRLDKVEQKLSVVELKQNKLKDDFEGLQLNTGIAHRAIRKDIHELKDVTETVVKILQMNNMLAG